MNRIDIESCTSIEDLKELCLAYRKACFCISETLVDESKWHITVEKAKEYIKKYLREVNNAEDKFVKKVEESVEKSSKSGIMLELD